MSLDAIALGATLYMPATREDAAARLLGPQRIAGLRSAVLCLEDAVREDGVPLALARLAATLRHIAMHPPAPGDALIFVRPRDPAMLGRILALPGADRLTGFVLPKPRPATMPCWLALPFSPHHRLMPTLETREAFDPVELRALREQLLAVQGRILALRIGGNDLLHAMGLRRAAGRTVYQGPLGPVIATLVAGFAPWGFALTAPVMERFDDPALLRAEMAEDIAHGLLGKTAIHPDQIAVIQTALAVPADLVAEAQAILSPQAPAVFAREGAMCEPATHRAWAERLLARADAFGIADALPLALRA